MIELIKSNSNALNAICAKHFVAELYLFGSALTGVFSADSDLDFAVLFSESLQPLEHGDAFFGLKDDLETLFNRPIDLISYRALKNPIFKSELDKTKVSLYAA
ncbi:nucleotidyltransferase domain-containing protein [Cryomorpha ignava]|uniref:Nucleotidyltransferase domain-containing protein n=1 Tax=Cryomorpha ignava TaxID=101383 RepID=A0A7K3WT39_9FLAO|nr:nucleotidyltransferase domain-containing protein [Cryomorpha ignava]NEN24626.1 nucleotidyltransferase domain-containing protein [Cryomorpha ignava]